jgi:hypothetical protein
MDALRCHLRVEACRRDVESPLRTATPDLDGVRRLGKRRLGDADDRRAERLVQMPPKPRPTGSHVHVTVDDGSRKRRPNKLRDSQQTRQLSLEEGPRLVGGHSIQTCDMLLHRPGVVPVAQHDAGRRGRQIARMDVDARQHAVCVAAPIAAGN